MKNLLWVSLVLCFVLTIFFTLFDSHAQRAVEQKLGIRDRGNQWYGFIDQSATFYTNYFTFENTPTDLGNPNYYDGDFADFDGDGSQDRMLIARYGLLWNSTGGNPGHLNLRFTPLSTQPMWGPPLGRETLNGFRFGADDWYGDDAAQWADVDGDGDFDAVMGGNFEPLTIQENREGRFQTIRHSITGPSALNIVNTDMEGDGDLDLILACSFCSNNACGGPVSFHLMENVDGRGTYQRATVPSGLQALKGSGEFVVGAISGDVDDDGDLDIIVIHGREKELKLCRNDGAGHYTLESIAFARLKSLIGSITSGFGQGLNFGDIDDDGDLDIVLALPSHTVSDHPKVSHIIWTNDGNGYFDDESLSRFQGDYRSIQNNIKLTAENGKLVDVDYDGDLDFVTLRKVNGGSNVPELGPPGVTFEIFLNNGHGVFVYQPALGYDFNIPNPTDLGADLDVTDLDGDGVYDLWAGLAGADVRVLINSFPDNNPDIPRNPRVNGVADDGITISWQAPTFASNARYYEVYRSCAPDMHWHNWTKVKTIGFPHQDEGCVAPITRHTLSGYLNELDVELDGTANEIAWTDRNVRKGIKYYYAIAHVGTENTRSKRTKAIDAMIPLESSTFNDRTPPVLEIVHPRSQFWGQHPKIVACFSDEKGIDNASLHVSFDVPLGGLLPAGTNLASKNLCLENPNTFVYQLRPEEALPLNKMATLTFSVSDIHGNVSVVKSRVLPSEHSGSPPDAFIFVHGIEGKTIDLSSRFSYDDGVVTWHEWYFGDGTTAIGARQTHTYKSAGQYVIQCYVRDNHGGIDVESFVCTIND